MKKILLLALNCCLLIQLINAQAMDRKAVVLRHTVVNKSYDSLSSLPTDNDESES